MTGERYRFDVLRGLLRHPNRDPAVVAVFGAAAIDAIDLRDFQSYLELQAEGFDVVFQKAPFVVAADEILNEDDLHIAAYHFRREGHDGFAEYSLALPGGIMFGDTSDIVRGKLGDPERVGGGAYVPLLKKNAPRFWRYLLGTDQLNIRLDDAERVQMVTLQVPSRLDELAAAASGPAPR